MWIALFSQTGGEICSVSQSIGVAPNIIMTNNKDRTTWNSNIELLGSEIIVSSHKNLMKELLAYKEDTIVTLHGYLRIIPENVALECNIYNGHPAPIHLYPELKGKDKQEDLYTYKDKYSKIGCVVHKVVPELDAGEIIVKVTADNNLQSIDDAYSQLKHLSHLSWCVFFKGRFDE